MARAAHELGWQVEVLAPGSANPDDTSLPFPVKRMGHRGKQDWLARLSLLRYLRKRGSIPGERLVFAEPGAVRAMLYSFLFRIKLPIRPDLILHGSDIVRFSAAFPEKLLFHRFLKKARRIHVLSKANRDLLLSRFPNLSTPVIVAPGAPTRMTAPNQLPEKQPSDRVTILTVGRIHPRKGQLTTLEALSRLTTTDQQKIRYRIVGPCVRDAYRRKILKLASRCPFPVELTGPLSPEALEAEYRDADIFALTSQQTGKSVEGFGLVYLDASAHGLPNVATRSGGVPEAVLHEQTGLLASENSIDEISSCFRRLIQDPELRKCLGKKGMEFAQSLEWEKTAKLVFGDPSTT